MPISPVLCSLLSQKFQIGKGLLKISKIFAINVKSYMQLSCNGLIIFQSVKGDKRRTGTEVQQLDGIIEAS